MAEETTYSYNVLGSEFTREYEKGWNAITSDRAYSILGGEYGIRGQDATKYSWHQQMGAYPTKGFIGKGSGELDQAFMNLLDKDQVNLSHREAKFHMNKYLFGMKGGMGRRFRATYADAITNIKNFELAVYGMII